MAADYATTGDLPAEFASVAPNTLQEALDLVRSLVSPKFWLEQTSNVHALLAAHWLKLHGHGSASGAMTPAHTRQVGKVRMEGALPTAFLLPHALRRTSYGQLYLQIAESRGPALMVV